MKKWVVVGIALVMVLTLFAGVALTAPPSQAQDVTVTAKVAQAIWLGLSTNTIDLGTVAPDGTTHADGGLTATVRSNWDWELSYSPLVLSGTADTGLSDPPTVTLEDEYLKINGASAADGGVLDFGGRTGEKMIPVTYALDIDWGAAPATYTGTHTYTLVFK